jgi:prepilin-type N-terminal cleavage/methylation domain-containing protein
MKNYGANFREVRSGFTLIELLLSTAIITLGLA